MLIKQIQPVGIERTGQKNLSHRTFLSTQTWRGKFSGRWNSGDLTMSSKSAGKGALTALLLAELPTITAVEIDDQLAAELQATHGNALTVYHDDVLNLDPRSIAKGQNGKLRIVGNIPYNITSPILFWAIDSSDVIMDCTLMIQHEVARRLVAKPRSKEYGILSVFAQYYSAPELKFTVAPGSFYPVPEVTSAVVLLDFQRPHLHVLLMMRCSAR